MADRFDPYHKWLGISPREQPPNHYRLLGLERFESDVEVIDAAANRQMSYVQSCAEGRHLALSQKLLNEIAAARLCLLDAGRKQAYDDQLRRAAGRRKVRAATPPPPPPPPGAPPVPTAAPVAPAVPPVPTAAPVAPAVPAALPLPAPPSTGPEVFPGITDPPSPAHGTVPAEEASQRPSRRAQTILIGSGVAALAVLIAVVAFVASGRKGQPPGAAQQPQRLEARVSTRALTSPAEESGQPDVAQGDDSAQPGDPSVEPPDEKPPAPPTPPEPAPTETPPATSPAQPSPPQPEKPKPAPPKTAPRAPPDPFAAVPAVVELPPLPEAGSADAGAAQQVIGRLAAAPEVALTAKLLGGENALRGQAHLSLEPLEDGRAWQVDLHSAEQTAPVAQLAVRGRQLSFAWAPGATAAANALRNCAFSLQAQGKTHVVALRAPLAVQPLEFDLEKPAVRGSLDVPWTPDERFVRVEVTGIAGAQQQPVTLAEPLPAELGTAWVLVGEGKLPVMALRVDTHWERDLAITMKVHFQAPSGGKPQRLTIDKTRQGLVAASAARDDLQKRLDVANGFKQKSKSLLRQIDEMNQQLKALDALIQRANQFDALCKLLHGRGRLRYRVYYQAGPHQVTLAQTPLPETKPPARRQR